MAKDLDYSKLSQEELVQLLKEKDQTIEESTAEFKKLSLQKDKDGLPVLSLGSKVYQAIVHTVTLPSGEAGEVETQKVIIKDLTEADSQIIESLIKKGLLVEVKA